MFKIAKSLVVVFALVAVTTGATFSVFTAEAKVTGNTFATGSLEIRVDGKTNTTGFSFDNAAPGDSTNGGFDIENWNHANFGGSSTLNAKVLKLSAVKTSGNSSLFNKLQVQVVSTVGWNSTTVWNGNLKDLVNKDILLPGNQLQPGWTMPMTYIVTLPADADSSLMGKTTTFDFVVDGATS
jgi:hypothetical protein